ncbi:MAG: response regulator transcription factor [Chitinophaga sp.]|uniref:response regulator transcription factor n=1 Tax=Chitinophaga sp. TaxID=1869181 RepID=UPI0025BE43C3|nr:response regulator transcription factor [Chitinophaga sp.]MBV8255556.1 response regulator transcription factor [Chitinophaga sp.]
MKLLLIEDEPAVVSVITRGLTEAGYEVTVAPDGATGLQLALDNRTFSLIILDVMLPALNGIEVCKAIRREEIATPILMLTALGTTENIVMGLDSGADDYLVKPFKLAELEARIRSLLRRKSNTTPVINSALLQIGNLTLDTDTKAATRAGNNIQLTATEYRLLEFLLKNPRRVLSRMELLEQVWGIDFNMNTKVVDVYINYLRKKINKNNQPELIQTVTGLGYMMKENNEDTA